MKPEESIPKHKIAELGQTIAQRAKDAEAIEKDYAAAMDRGNDLLADNDFNGAISAYTEALSIKPEEKEPKEKIEEAKRRELAQNEAAIAFEQLLADARTQISAGELRRAEELLNRAKNEAPGDDRPQKMLDEIAEIIKVRAEYDGLMSSAESKASSKDYEAAIEYFEKAKQLILSESKPDKRIADMNRLIAQEGDTKEMEELYADNMRKGGLAEGAERFEEALSFYQNALGVKAGDRACLLYTSPSPRD